MISQSAYSSSGPWGAEAWAGSLGHKAGTTLDRMPFQHRTTHIHTHTLTGTSYAHPFTTHAQLWVVVGAGNKVPGKNPCRPEENMQTPHSVSDRELIFFYHCHNERTMNETKLLEDSLYILNSGVIQQKSSTNGDSSWLLHTERGTVSWHRGSPF